MKAREIEDIYAMVRVRDGTPIDIFR